MEKHLSEWEPTLSFSAYLRKIPLQLHSTQALKHPKLSKLHPITDYNLNTSLLIPSRHLHTFTILATPNHQSPFPPLSISESSKHHPLALPTTTLEEIKIHLRTHNTLLPPTALYTSLSAHRQRGGTRAQGQQAWPPVISPGGLVNLSRARRRRGKTWQIRDTRARFMYFG